MFDEELFNKYPYAFEHEVFTGAVIDEKPNSLDEKLPIGWHKLFWQCMDDIKSFVKSNFYFTKVEVQNGQIMFEYKNGDVKVEEILLKYSHISTYVCQYCGEPARVTTKGWWMESLCEKCCTKLYPFAHTSDVNFIDKAELVFYVMVYPDNGDKRKLVFLDCSEIWEKLWDKGVFY